MKLGTNFTTSSGPMPIMLASVTRSKPRAIGLCLTIIPFIRDCIGARLFDGGEVFGGENRKKIRRITSIPTLRVCLTSIPKWGERHVRHATNLGQGLWT